MVIGSGRGFLSVCEWSLQGLFGTIYHKSFCFSSLSSLQEYILSFRFSGFLTLKERAKGPKGQIRAYGREVQRTVQYCTVNSPTIFFSPLDKLSQKAFFASKCNPSAKERPPPWDRFISELHVQNCRPRHEAMRCRHNRNPLKDHTCTTEVVRAVPQ